MSRSLNLLFKDIHRPTQGWLRCGFRRSLGERADGDARQGVRRPPPRNRLFAPRDNNDSWCTRRRPIARSGLELDTSTRWQQMRPADGLAVAGRCWRNRCKDQWRTILGARCNRPWFDADPRRRVIWTSRHRSSSCVSSSPLAETRSRRHRVSRR